MIPVDDRTAGSGAERKAERLGAGGPTQLNRWPIPSDRGHDRRRVPGRSPWRVGPPPRRSRLGLRRVILREAKLRGANFSHAQLSGGQSDGSVLGRRPPDRYSPGRRQVDGANLARRNVRVTRRSGKAKGPDLDGATLDGVILGPDDAIAEAVKRTRAASVG